MTPERKPDPRDAGDALRRLRERLAQERSWRGRLRELSTPVRIGAGLAAVAVVAGAVFLLMRRGDFAAYPRPMMATCLVALAALATFAVRLFLRPVHEREPGRAAFGAWLVVALAFPFALYLLPEAHQLVHEHPESFEGRGADFWPRTLRCLAFGALTALPLLALLLLSDRRDRIGPGRLALLAGAAGLGGNLVLMLHCPLVGRAHLLVGHAGVAVVFLFALGAAFVLRRRARAHRKM